jgi:hypothetical protein
VLARPPAAPAVGAARCPGLESPADGAHQPRVDGEALAAGRVLDPGLELFGKAQGDPGRRPVVGVGSCRGHDVVRGRSLLHDLVGRRRSADHEADVAAPEPDVHGTGSQLAGDLLGRRREGAEQGEAQRRLQRGREPLGQCSRLVTTDLGGGEQLRAQLVDVRSEVHGDSMTSL